MVQTVQMIMQIPWWRYFSRWSMALLRPLTSKLWWFRSCSSPKVVVIPVVTQRLILMVQTVQKTQRFRKRMFAPGNAVSRASFRDAEPESCPRCRRQFCGIMRGWCFGEQVPGADRRCQVRAHRRLRWHAFGWFCWFYFLALCSFLLSSGRRCSASWPEWIMQRDVLTLLFTCPLCATTGARLRHEFSTDPCIWQSLVWCLVEKYTVADSSGS